MDRFKMYLREQSVVYTGSLNIDFWCEPRNPKLQNPKLSWQLRTWLIDVDTSQKYLLKKPRGFYLTWIWMHISLHTATGKIPRNITWWPGRIIRRASEKLKPTSAQTYCLAGLLFLLTWTSTMSIFSWGDGLCSNCRRGNWGTALSPLLAHFTPRKKLPFLQYLLKSLFLEKIRTIILSLPPKGRDYPVFT